MFGLLLFLYSLIVHSAPCLFHSYTTSLDSYNKSIRLLLSTYLLPGKAFTEPLVSKLEATTHIANFNILTLPSSQHTDETFPLLTDEIARILSGK
jgi:hypothetical protein